MSKFTPGPWYWSDRFEASARRETWSLLGENGYGILSCDGAANSPQGLHDQANARLIAAAPDLLEALSQDFHADSCGCTRCLIKHKALAKARGESK